MATQSAESRAETLESTRGNAQLRAFFERGQLAWKKVDDDAVEPAARDKTIVEALTALRVCQQLVAKEALFSRNDLVEDIQTSHLQYLLIEYYIGTLLLRQFDMASRLVNIQQSDAMFTSFLDRCIDLGVVSKDEKEEARMDRGQLSAQDIRELKIKRFQRERHFKATLEALKTTTHEEDTDLADDENARELVLANVRYFVQRALTEQENIAQEIQILKHMATMRKPELRAPGPDPSERSQPGVPEKVFLDPNRPGLDVTRIDASGKVKRETVKTQVFQPFHNQPTMTLSELADIELQDAKERESRQGQSNAVKSYDQLLEEGLEDDMDLVDKATIKDRAWDDWKDDHQKGAGNKGGSQF